MEIPNNHAIQYLYTTVFFIINYNTGSDSFNLFFGTACLDKVIPKTSCQMWVYVEHFLSYSVILINNLEHVLILRTI